jgi:hypothetical protein
LPDERAIVVPGFLIHRGEIMKSRKLARFKLRALNAALASAVALGGVGVGISADAVTLTNGTANATVVTPIAINQTTPLSFGRFSTPGTAGSVTIAATVGGARTVSGGTVLVTTGGPTALGNSGVCAVNGEPNLIYTVSALTATALTRTGGGGVDMPLAIVTSPAAGSATGLLDASGAQTLYVGGTLTVAGTQTPGTYTGTYSVTVEYN